MSKFLVSPSRRQALAGALGLGLTVEFIGGKAFAAANAAVANKKLVVVICRGGMDGLSVSPPAGDPNYAALRGSIAIPGFGQPGGALRLDDTFGLHPSLTATHALALKGEARIAPAIASPDRARSHFEAQDTLENGGTSAYALDSGWLNRALQAMGPGKVKAISVGPTAPLILRGPVEAASWSAGPGAGRDPRLPGILQDIYAAADPALSRALASGLATEQMARVATTDARAALAQPIVATGPQMGAAAVPGAPVPVVGPPSPSMTQMQPSATPDPRTLLRQTTAAARQQGATLAGFMIQPGGPQLAAVSLDGFDTHANQGSSQGQLATRLSYLDATLDGLATGMGAAWKDTVVVVVTEFGRTAHVNGTAGTDHGTASTALLLGGALAKGGIVGDWPTLAQGKLFENRDTAPTVDMRALFKGLLADHYSVARPALDSAIFPDSVSTAPLRGLVA
jgi:uncharacterized protein (DUF1501 family)